MKRSLLVGALIFSVALNVTVAATLVWNLWLRDRFETGAVVPGIALTRSDVRRIATITRKNHWESMRRHREKVLRKNAEILDTLAADPNNVQAADKAVEELISLKGELEKQSIERLRRIMNSLPEEKKKALAAYQYIPVALVVTGVGEAAGKRDRMAVLAMEGEALDSISGKRLAAVVQKKANQIPSKSANELVAEDVYPSINLWAQKMKQRLLSVQ